MADVRVLSKTLKSIPQLNHENFQGKLFLSGLLDENSSEVIASKVTRCTDIIKRYRDFIKDASSQVYVCDNEAEHQALKRLMLSQSMLSKRLTVDEIMSGLEMGRQEGGLEGESEEIRLWCYIRPHSG